MHAAYEQPCATGAAAPRPDPTAEPERSIAVWMATGTLSPDLAASISPHSRSVPSRADPSAPQASLLLVGSRPADGSVQVLRAVPGFGERALELVCPPGMPALAHSVARGAHSLAVVEMAWLRHHGPVGLPRLNGLQQPMTWILGAPDMPDDWFECLLACRARGIVTWNQPPDLLARAMAAIERGDVWMPRSATRLMYEWLLSRGVGDGRDSHPAVSDTLTTGRPTEPLSAREQEILGAVRRGLTNKEIAREFGVSANTVKKHLGKALGKLGIRSRRQIAY